MARPINWTFLQGGMLWCLCVVLLALPNAGCWSRKEVDHLGLVVQVGIDREDNGDFRFELKTVKPGLVAGGGSGGGGGGGGAAGKPFWIAQATGKTLSEAFTRLQTYTPRRPFLAHCQAIIISEEVAQNQLGPVLDFLSRQREFRRTAYVFISRKKALDILGAESPLEATPGVDVSELIMWMNWDPKIMAVSLNDFFRALSLPWIEPFMGLVDLVTPAPQKTNTSGGGGGASGGGSGKQEASAKSGEEQDLQVAGAAVFKGTRMVGYLTPVEAQTLNWLIGRAGGGVITVPMPEGAGQVQEASIRVNATRVSIKARGTTGVVIHIDQEGGLLEDSGGAAMSVKLLESIEKRAATLTQNRVAALVNTLQKKHGVDTLGLGRVLYRKDHQAWARLSKDWDQLYPDLPVKVESTFRLRNTGMTIHSPR